MKKFLSVLLLSTILLTGCKSKETKEVSKDDVQVITENEVIKDQDVDGLKLTNTSLTSVNGIWTLVTEVSNTTGNDYNLDEFTINLKDGEGNTLKSLRGYVGEVIKNNETKVINTSTDFDLSNVVKVEYEIKK